MHNGGKWTDGKFNSFIKSALRSASNRWPPKWEVSRAARVERGKYRCAGYGRDVHIVGASVVDGKGKRIKNVFIDHIHPVGGPSEGGWDGVIRRLYCEVDGLQVLCKDCHDRKTKSERKKKND